MIVFVSTALYREVPRPEEVVGLGNFMPRIADNAEALIDYALSHVPPSKTLARLCCSDYSLVSIACKLKHCGICARQVCL